MDNINRLPGPVGFVNEEALKQMLSGESVQCKLSRMKSGCMVYPLFDAAAADDALLALEMVAAEDDAGNGRLTSGVRAVINEVLIKAGRKAAPEPVRHFRACGEGL
ncbi:hypothetical protein BLA13014_04117 [Burkholderia aenigmatica]|uniref:Uncharacterized protein n=1 Tax=Burkholderia aenigmatica TaxID=2015348 RepID=A0A6P2MSX8_9BURK|nr:MULTISPECIES: hypothetical protein [Burkholderia]VWB88902.1 hypothetical protein BLA13014_04117 [Burkholderia aenigmatica]